jgi:hypothetical protein
MAGRVGVLHRQHDVELLALRLDLGEVVEMQHRVVQPAGDQSGAGAGAKRDLLDIVELHVLAAGRNHRAQRDRAGAVDRVDADVLAGEVLAGFAGLARA